ncbi:MAG: hypothetical protein ACPG7F_06175 [Aggregatilineales bacterium]
MAAAKWCIHPAAGGYVVAWRDATGTYGDFTPGEPITLWYAMYQQYRERMLWQRVQVLKGYSADETVPFNAVL